MSDEERPAPRRLGKRGTFRSLTAAEYAAKRGVSLFAKAIDPNRNQPQKTTSGQTDSSADDPKRSETQ